MVTIYSGEGDITGLGEDFPCFWDDLGDIQGVGWALPTDSSSLRRRPDQSAWYKLSRHSGEGQNPGVLSK